MSENLIGEKLGNYRLERLLGRGRMGVVYLARDEALLRPTAVKILSWSIPDAAGQNPEAWFIAEARNVARINHPHVVQIYSVARHGTHCYIAMEYVDGTTADVWVAQHGPCTVELATELLIQAADALQAAHDANVIHRDIKPENLLVRSDGKAKLGDFGMALHTSRPRAMDATRVGTPYYTAPEIWRGCVASVSSDIYALGATYYFLLTGRPPFIANELQELIGAHLHSPIPEVNSPHGNVPAGCQELVHRCLAKTPQQRLPSAQAVGWEARALLHRLVSIPPSSGKATTVGLQPQDSQGVAANTFDTSSIRTAPPPKPRPYWQTFFGLVREPFTQYEIGRAPYQGEPFLSILDHLNERLRDANGATALLVGASGMGRTSLVQELLVQRASYGPCMRVSCQTLGTKQTLIQKVLFALGAPTVNSGFAQNDIDALVEHCLAMRNTASSPLLVLDDCEKNAKALGEIDAISLAAQHTKCFRLLLLGTTDFADQLARHFMAAQKQPLPLVQLPAFNGLQVADYVTSWLAFTLAAEASPPLFTPDALLIVAHRSEGVPTRINRLVTSMLQAAARQERRLLDSWHAWSAPLDPSERTLEVRPESWPTDEALQVLNHCRLQVGMQTRHCYVP